MIRFFPNEKWKEFHLERKAKYRYAVSNYGRVISFSDKIENGRLLKCGLSDGYPIFRYQITKGKKLMNKTLFVRKLVAENFLKKTSEDQTYVLLLDRNRTNNFVNNLKWATKEEMIEHSKKSPMVIKSRKNAIEQKKKIGKGHKLNSSTVRVIKKRIFAPDRKTRMRIIAKQFGISEMQLYRIKSGENWGHVKID